MSMFKITIKRTAPQGKEKELLDLITQLRVKASGQQGYVSGETPLNAKVPGEFLVISVWDREVDWNKWAASEVRKTVEDRIEALIGANSIYSTYSYPHLSHAA